MRRVFLLGFLLATMQVLAQSDNERSNDAINSQNDSSDNVGETRFITDELYTFMHSGPGRNYRILGSVSAGSKVTQLQVDTESNYVEIVDERQRSGWVDGRHISSSESIRSRLPVLEQQLSFSAEQLVEQQTEIEELNQQIQDLTQSRQQLETEYADLQRRHALIEEQMTAKDQSSDKEWFMRGGMLALAGIILGVIIAYLPKKKRRNDSWM